MNSQLTRRDFIKLIGATGAGLVLAVYLDACAPTTEEVPTATPKIPTTTTPRPSFDWIPNLYLKLDNAGILTVIAFRSEMGQGIRTALAMLVADELDVDWKNVRIEQAPADRRFGDQQTGGSVSISNYYTGMRLAGAIARQMLLMAAAESWSVDTAQCKTEAGFVIHPDGQQKMAYGDLVEAAAKLEVPNRAQIKEKSQWRIIGQGHGHWDAPQIVIGNAIYGLDVRLPGMLFAALARCPVFGGELVSYDDTAAKAVPGVRQVIQIGNKIAVIAENTWAAIQGCSALVVNWNEGENNRLSSENVRLSAVNGFPQPGTDSNVLDAIYEMPYEAHATMEPMNCTAYVHDGVCEVWAPTQSPQQVQLKVASVISMAQKDVTVHVPLIGGGFGRRHQTDFAEEAALISKEVGVPVKVVWTREDDLQHDFYHDLAVQYASIQQGKVAPPRISIKRGPASVPTGWWRSVDEFPQAYANECFIDEMATALRRDPLDVHLEIYSGRAAEVIKLAAEKAKWGKTLPQGWGRGLAYHATFNVTHVAYVVEVFVEANGNVRVERVVAAVDCGQAVNPDNVKAQIEGGIVFGLTATLKAEATLEDGRIQQSNFHDYPLLRMDEMPKVEVYIVESDQRPMGIGEMGVPPIAPAVANAVYAATGKRIRHIPIRPEDLKT